MVDVDDSAGGMQLRMDSANRICITEVILVFEIVP